MTSTSREVELEAALRSALLHLWTDFSEARRRALIREFNVGDRRRGWSIEMCNLEERIADITQLVGPTSWEQVPLDLLERDGWYEEIHRAMGVEAPINHVRAAQVRERYEAQRMNQRARG